MPEAEVIPFPGDFVGPQAMLRHQCSDVTAAEINQLVDWLGVDIPSVFSKALDCLNVFLVTVDDARELVFYLPDGKVGMSTNSFAIYNSLFRFTSAPLTTVFTLRLPEEYVTRLEKLRVDVEETTIDDLISQALHTLWSWVDFHDNHGRVVIKDADGTEHPIINPV